MKKKGDKCKRLVGLKSRILEELTKGAVTTGKLKDLLFEDYNTTWKTMNRYLLELEEEGLITKLVLHKCLNLTIWVKL